MHCTHDAVCRWLNVLPAQIGSFCLHGVVLVVQRSLCSGRVSHVRARFYTSPRVSFSWWSLALFTMKLSFQQCNMERQSRNTTFHSAVVHRSSGDHSSVHTEGKLLQSQKKARAINCWTTTTKFGSLEKLCAPRISLRKVKSNGSAIPQKFQTGGVMSMQRFATD